MKAIILFVLAAMTIVAPALGQSAPPVGIPVVATVSALARADFKLSPILYLQGYRAPADGGEGLLQIQQASKVAANGCTVFSDAAGNKFVRTNIAGGLSVLQCGAHGTGAAGNFDDGPSISAAIAAQRGADGHAIGKVLIPAILGNGTRLQYLIKTPINATGTVSVDIEGVGGGITAIAANVFSPLLLCATGARACLDRTGANNSILSRVMLSNYASGPGAPLANASCVGVLDARPDGSLSGGFAQLNVIRDSGIFLADLPACNRGYGTIALYNVGAELADYDHVQLFADRPLFLDSRNRAGIASSYAALAQTPTSTTEIVCSNMCVLSSAGNYVALTLCGVQNVEMGASFANGAHWGMQLLADCGASIAVRWHGRWENGAAIAPFLRLDGGASLQLAELDMLAGVGAGPAISMEASKNCAAIASSVLRFTNIEATGSVLATTGTGCAGAMLDAVDFRMGSYHGLTLNQGKAVSNVRFYDNIVPVSVTLPAGSRYTFPDLSGAGRSGP